MKVVAVLSSSFLLTCVNAESVRGLTNRIFHEKIAAMAVAQPGLSGDSTATATLPQETGVAVGHHQGHGKKFKEHCDPVVSVPAGDFVLESHGHKNHEAGWQCAKLTHKSHSCRQVKWKTTWSWSATPEGAKAFPHLAQKLHPIKLNGWHDVLSEWEWSISPTADADVLYKLATTETVDGPIKNIVNIVVGQYGNHKYGKEIVNSVKYHKHHFQLFEHSADVSTYTFVISEPAERQSSFRGNLLWFVKYLVEHEKLSDEQYLLDLKAGVETHGGKDCTFKTTYFRVAKNSIKKMRELLGQ